MERVFVKFDIEPMSTADGYAVCEFVDGLPVRQVSIVGDRIISSLVDSDPEVGATLTELALDADWRAEEPELQEVDADYFERLWGKATSG
jgi:hypothetical protein